MIKTITIMTSIAAITIASIIAIGVTAMPAYAIPGQSGPTTATFNYCAFGTCHIDFQDPDGVGSTTGDDSGTTPFGSCPVGTPGQFTGAWAHSAPGTTISATDCLGLTTDLCFEFDKSISNGICVVVPEIEKTLVSVEDTIGISLDTATLFKYIIEYTGPAALVTDTVPAEFEILSAVSGDDVVTIANQGKGKKSQGATKIEWNVQAGTSTLIVDIQTVESPGKGHKLTVFKPTSCGALAINDGATAFEVNADGTLRLIEVPDPVNPGETILVPVVIVGPSNSLEVEAVDGAKLCIEIENGN